MNENCVYEIQLLFAIDETTTKQTTTQTTIEGATTSTHSNRD